MYMPPGTKLKLDARDEYTHEPEAASNYNESMYFNAFDSRQGIGCWMRIGNRPNEGHAEMTCCVYLPDGRVGFMFARPAIIDNKALAAAGMRFEVVEPLRCHRVTYSGELLIMDDPLAMADPSSAFKRYPKRAASIDLIFTGVSPMHGGEIVDADGSPIELDPETSVYRGHTEQMMAVTGRIVVDGLGYDVSQGTGYRDKSWGPRFWHSFFWYKWLPVTFSPTFAALLSIKGDPAGGPNRVSGNVLDGDHFDPIVAGKIDVDYAPAYLPKTLTARFRTARRDYVMTAEVLATVPLRHRRPGQDDRYVRITESMSRYQCDDHETLGMTEFTDLVVGGIPISEKKTPAAA
ncbi:hypothetical protein PQ455_11050 [Sphingomonas naphthae]|uniref:DUF7064 domain-containing protein n=1 Tax=Sphingomonas naphthae TaxID=1813468 RepID=A0ABY7TIN2_9SPHN|nr:hypothetical protein [Sphingomonas naphthae]WCT72179.1 hypothetical protein PQ455_11050 [Sphingomonas naphthae]